MTQSPTTTTDNTAMSRQRIAELRVQCQTEPRSIEVHQQAIEEFLSAGLSGEALPLLRRLVALTPDDIHSVALFARVLAERGQHRDAVAQFTKLTELAPNDPAVWHDLGVAACSGGEYVVAREAFEKKLELEPNSHETLNDLAVLYAMDHRIDDAIAAYRRCLTVMPGYEKGRHNAFQFLREHDRTQDALSLIADLTDAIGDTPDLDEWRRRFTAGGATGTAQGTKVDTEESTAEKSTTLIAGKKIAFFASSDTFLRPIMQHFAAHNDVRAVHPQSSAELAEIMHWADLSWFEWCDGLVIQGSQLRKTGKTVCRLHSYEAFTDMPQQVNWRNVDRLILVNQSVGEILDRRQGPKVDRVVIPNGIDPTRFPVVPRSGCGKRIASVGYINYKKNPSLLLQTFKAIHDADPEFELHIAGSHQDPRLEVYMESMLARWNLPVTFHNWVEDMPSFYAKMDYVISTSLFESFHYSIAEGMLSGCLPLVHCWKGADYVYPESTLFDTPESARALIARYQAGDIDAIRTSHRQHIIERFNWSDRLDEIDRMLHDVLMGRRPQNTTDRRTAKHASATV